MDDNANLKKIKDNWANGDLYERYVGRWSRLVAREFLKWLAVPAGGKWLDIGCGTGALSQTILEVSAPAGITALDRSEAFVTFASNQIANKRIQFEVGDAISSFRYWTLRRHCVGTRLNFIPQPELALAGMRSAARKGGIVAGYVWDYAEGMQLMRHFWDAAVALDPKVMMTKSNVSPIPDPSL